MVLQFDEIVERYLRPRALTENLDNSSWNDKTQVWIRTESSSADTLAFVQGTLFEATEINNNNNNVKNNNNNMVQVKLFNGKVNNPKR